jgi:hypothetical protein
MMKKLLLAAALLAVPASAHACELFMEQQGQSVHVIIKACVEPFDKWFTLSPKRKECGTTHIDRVERTDETTYLVYTTNQSCVPKLETLQFQIVGDDTLRITNVEGY